jgi:hypothetical protein
MILMLVGCMPFVRNPNEHTGMRQPQLINLTGNESLIVIGSSIRGASLNIGGGQREVYSVWVSFDAATHKTTNQNMLTIPEDCGALLSKSKGCNGIQYYAFKVTAGDYAFAWIFHVDRLYSFINFAKLNLKWQVDTLTNYEMTDQAPVGAQTSTFHIGSGEVLYVGDVLLDFSDVGVVKPTISTSSAQQVQAFLAPTGLADKLVVRAMGPLPTVREQRLK